MKISACWIVKNESAELAASIMSVRDCADELIVVDTGSTDDTAAVAKEHGARVEHFKWVDDFSAARNFCLSFATGEYVIFLDADEYFEPALNIADRNIIADIFKRENVDTIQLNRIELDLSSGEIIGSEPHARIMRRGAVRYINRIHELLTANNGSAPRTFLLGDYKLMHTGYSASRVTDKYLRNIRYLEAQKSELAVNNKLELFHNHAYLMREYSSILNYKKAFDNCRYLLDNYEQWDIACKVFSSHYIQRFYTALNLMTVNRFWFSRGEVYKKLIKPVLNIYSEFREAPIIELYYRMIADYRGDSFLRQLESIDQSSPKLSALDATESRNAEAAVYGRGALEAYYRGEHEKAKRYAKIATRIVPESNAATLAALSDGSFSGDGTQISLSILNGEYKEAYDLINLELNNRPLDHSLLEFLHIIADKEGGELAYSARKEYEIKRSLLDEAIDLSDFVNTGYLDSDEITQQQEELKRFDFDALVNILEEYKSRVVTDDILTLHSLAAPVYEEKGLTVLAMRSHALLIAKEREPEKHRRELERLFSAI